MKRSCLAKPGAVVPIWLPEALTACLHGHARSLHRLAGQAAVSAIRPVPDRAQGLCSKGGAVAEGQC